MQIRAFMRRRRKRSLGQSLVEFALLLPVFLVITAVALDLGRIAYARVSIANVAREAAFQAAQTPTSYKAGQPCSSTDPSSNMVICRAILESKGSVVTVTPSDVTMTCNPSCAEAMGNTVTVTARGRFNLLTPVMAVFFGGTSISFSSTSTNQISALPPPPAWPPAAPPESEPTAVPDFAGQTEAQWLSLLSTAKLFPGTRSTNYNPLVPAGSIISSDPAPATTVGQGSTVNYVVSSGLAPDCTILSAGFTYTKSPSSGRSPLYVTVTDTTIYNNFCSTVWEWSWGDGAVTYGQVQPAHVYYNAGPGNVTYTVSLLVTSGSVTRTFGGYAITVKP
jgi:Flp pilus assembly protein TadG